ncbi:MAG TPA: uracil phosphoribosyltransferase, partial [Pirellulales bacterium]
FRRCVRLLTQVLIGDATRDLRVNAIRVPTVLAECDGHEIAESIGLFPVLRAGLGMVDPILEWLPRAQVWHLGVYRDDACRPVVYYDKLPPSLNVSWGLVLDPMLATGGSAVVAIDRLKRAGVSRLKFLGLIGAQAGVAALHAAHPDVPIHLAALDAELNSLNYIVPGLGDAGDRQFGTSGHF